MHTPHRDAEKAPDAALPEALRHPGNEEARWQAGSGGIRDKKSHRGLCRHLPWFDNRPWGDHTRCGMSGGSMSYVIVRHDYGCPMITPTPGECTCASPRPELVTRNKFVATVTRDRKARRAAARVAAKAMRKAKGVAA